MTGPTMPKALSRPSSYLIVLALAVSTLVVMASPALACHSLIATTATSTADGFTFEAQWTTVNSGNTGITGSVGAGSITWWLIDSYPGGDESTSEPTSHGPGQGVRFVVSGLAPGQSATATFSALLGANGDCSGPNTSLAQTSRLGSALVATGTAPTFSAVTRAADGFSFTITNFDGDGGYVLATTAGVVSRDGDVVTVSGLAPDTEATVTVTATKDGHTDASDSISGTSLATGTAPTFSVVTRTADGFSFTITNFDGDGSYVLATTAGVVSRDGDVVTVSGLAPDTEATVTVTATKDGHTDASDSISGTSLAAGTPPTFSAVTRTADGFSFRITNYNPDAVYDLSTTAGTVTREGDTIIVSGLAAGESSTVTVTVTVEGATSVSETVTDSALPAPAPDDSAPPPAAPDAERAAATTTLPETGATTAQLVSLAVLLLLSGMIFLRLTAGAGSRPRLRRS